MLDDKRKEELKKLTKHFGYAFKNQELLNKALTHKSFANENQLLGLKDNERFEFLGDSVIDLIVSRYLVHQKLDMSEGELSKIRAQIVNEQSLADFAREIDLGKYMLLGKGEEASGGREKNSLLSNTFEAVIAALFVDSSYDAVYQMFLSLYRSPIDKITEEKRIADYKGHLQKHCQSRILAKPHYRLICENGPDHDKVFNIQTFILGEPYGVGMGKTKKEAEQAAARISYDMLMARNKEII